MLIENQTIKQILRYCRLLLTNEQVLLCCGCSGACFSTLEVGAFDINFEVNTVKAALHSDIR